MSSSSSSDFGRFFSRHRRAVFAFFVKRVRDRAWADDATQETFLRAFAGLPSLGDPDRALPWLFGVAHNVLREGARARDRLVPLVMDRETAADTPETLLLRSELGRTVDGALRRLSSQRRTALLLCIEDEIDYREIGRRLAWPVSKVRNEVHRARVALRATL
jgi:RNA polymerase sigma-70 factor, ECF subfamily